MYRDGTVDNHPRLSNARAYRCDPKARDYAAVFDGAKRLADLSLALDHVEVVRRVVYGDALKMIVADEQGVSATERQQLRLVGQIYAQ